MNEPSKIFDGLLVLEYRSGSKKALGVLVKKYHPSLCKHANYYTKDVESAKDIVQDSWRVILRKLHTLKDPNLFGSWAFRIVTRKSLDFVNQDDYKISHLNQKEQGCEVEEYNEIVGLKIQKLRISISKLPENQQIVLRLFYTQQYSLKEISTILNISVGTVKSRLFHAREKLKTILKTKI